MSQAPARCSSSCRRAPGRIPDESSSFLRIERVTAEAGSHGSRFRVRRSVRRCCGLYSRRRGSGTLECVNPETHLCISCFHRTHSGRQSLFRSTSVVQTMASFAGAAVCNACVRHTPKAAVSGHHEVPARGQPAPRPGVFARRRNVAAFASKPGGSPQDLKNGELKYL